MARPMEIRVLRHGAVDSTNERALSAIRDGSARHGDLHFAAEQTAGRGRLGRSWVSPPGEGLYLSVVVRPGAMPLAGALTLAGGMALVDACGALGLPSIRLDWPNDLVAGAAKLGGVLVESRGLDRADPAFVVGVGLNVANRAFPDALRRERRVTSLRLEGASATVEDALAAAASALASRLPDAVERPAELFADAFEALEQARRDVRVDFAGVTHEGVLAALDPERGLRLTALGRPELGSWLPLAHVRSVRIRAASGAE